MEWFLIILAAGVFILLLLLCVESLRECSKFQMTHYVLEIPEMEMAEPEKKLLFLSDLHNYEFGPENRILLESIRRESPDMILAGGDMLYGKDGCSPEKAISFGKKLPEIAPVYYANGNHEQRVKENTQVFGNIYTRYKRELQSAGVHFLENKSVYITLGTFKICLSGLELPLEAYVDMKTKEISVKKMNQLLGRPKKEVYHILLAHTPEFFEIYKKWGADLTLSGHLHGGVVRVPKWRGIVTPRFTFFPKYSGEMTVEGSHTIIVSKGLGTHSVNLRIFNIPEAVVIHLRPCKKEELSV